MAFSLRCPDCRDKFPWEPSKDFPRFCPLCSADMGETTDNDSVVMPFIRSSEKTKRTDQVYRDLESASEQRVYQAAEMAGTDASDMKDLKITNMRDSVRDQPSVAPVQNVITEQMARTGQDGWGGGVTAETYGAGIASGAIVHNGQVTNGIAPRAGLTAMSRLQGMLTPIPGVKALTP